MRALFFSLLLICFCGGCSVTPEPRVIILSEKNSGTTIFCDVKDDIVIRLPANPTTGYLWKSAGAPDMDVIRLIRERYIQLEKDKGLCGAGGTREFRYHVVGSGNAAIRLEYSRPWENNPPAKKFQIYLHVPEKKPSKLFDDRYVAPRRGSKGQIEPFPADMRKK